MKDKTKPVSKQAWLPVFMKFIELLRIDSKEEAAQDSRGTKLELWDSQRIFLEEICEGLDRDVRHFVCLKSRQLGISTVSLALDVFWLCMHPGTIGALVIDSEGSKEVFRSTIRRYIESFPDNFFGSSFKIVKGGDNRNFMRFSNGSRLDFLVAGTRKKTAWAEGRAYTFCHCCVAKGTPVVVENGKIKPIEDIAIGEKIITHTGKVATVIANVCQPNTKGPMIKITPWMGQPVLCTKDHKISTARGMVKAENLKQDDKLIMPIRNISGGNKKFSLVSGRSQRNNNQGPMGAGAGKVLTLNEEVGYAVGYYLAEGSIVHNSYDGRPSGLCFTRHRNEKSYADRAINALKEFTTGNRKTTDRKNSLTSTDHIYGTPLAMWIANTFGEREGKFIPDDVFSWGEDFCRGLVSGILCGDGSKTISYGHTRQRPYKDSLSMKGKKLGSPRKSCDLKKRYELNAVSLPSTRSSLAMQTRDIVASLGYGWGSITYKAGGEYYGRLCKPQWTIRWSGSCARQLRKLMGLKDITRKGNDHTNKYIISGLSVLIKIRKIEHGFEEPEMWDISVDHDDHTFRTPFMSISNSEVSKYGSEEGLASFMETLAKKHPDRLFIFESTAAGFNHWKDMWDEAKRDSHGKKAIFIGWWSCPTNIIKKSDPRYVIYGQAYPDSEERELIDVVKKEYGYTVSQEQLAWYRSIQADASKSEQTTNQNQPWIASQSFVQPGFSFFPPRQLQKDYARIMGDVEGIDPPEFKGYKFVIGESFQTCTMEQITDQERIGEVTLRVWEEPVEEAQYVIGCDPAFGRNDWADRHAVNVFRCFADKLVQVAEYADNEVETHVCAWMLAYLAGSYRNSMVNVELTGGPGHAVIREFQNLKERMRSDIYRVSNPDYDWDDFLQNARWYLYHRIDSFGRGGYMKCFESSGKHKFDMMNVLRSNYSSNLLMLQSKPLIEEMFSVVQEGYNIEAPGRSKDDRVFAMGLANITWEEHFRPQLIALGETYQSHLNRGEGTDTPNSDMVNSIVRNFLKKQEEDEEEYDGRPLWLVERGLA